MTADMRSPAPAATGNGARIDKNKAEGLRSTKQSKRRQAAKAFFEGAAQLSPDAPNPAAHAQWKFWTIDAALADPDLLHAEKAVLIAVLQRTNAATRMARLAHESVCIAVSHMDRWRLTEINKKIQRLGYWIFQPGHGARSTRYQLHPEERIAYVLERVDLAREQLQEERARRREMGTKPKPGRQSRNGPKEAPIPHKSERVEVYIPRPNEAPIPGVHLKRSRSQEGLSEHNVSGCGTDAWAGERANGVDRGPDDEVRPAGHGDDDEKPIAIRKNTSLLSSEARDGPEPEAAVSASTQRAESRPIHWEKPSAPIVIPRMSEMQAELRLLRELGDGDVKVGAERRKAHPDPDVFDAALLLLTEGHGLTQRMLDGWFEEMAEPCLA